MKIQVAVKANAKCNKVEPLGEHHFKVLVKAPPQEGRANEAVIGALSEYYKLPKSCFKLRSGQHARKKVIEIIC